MKPWLLTWQYMTFYSHFIYWIIMPLSKWNMAHFTWINEAPPNHQLRSRRQHGANSHSQFQKQENKNSTKDSPWSWVTEDINSPVPVPHLPTPTLPTVSVSLELCHANRIDSANLKNLICDYHPLMSVCVCVYVYTHIYIYIYMYIHLYLYILYIFVYIMYIFSPQQIFAKRGRERERVVLTEAKALPSASPVCELPVGFPRFVAAKKKHCRRLCKSNPDKWKLVTRCNSVTELLNWFSFSEWLPGCANNYGYCTELDIQNWKVIYQLECIPMTPSVVVAVGVWVALTNGEVLVLLRWKLDIGGRLALMSGETECAG